MLILVVAVDLKCFNNGAIKSGYKILGCEI